jgi:nucleoside-diphosphate-sugar epimerase
MKTVAILGAAGRIGEAATKAFLAAGWRVRGIARGAKVSTLADGVEPVTADAFDRQSLIDACNGADVILHALNPSYDKWAETVMPLAENVLAAAEASGATVMIPGNVYNFGTHIGIDTSETDPMRPDVEKGKIRVDMESLFERASRTRGVRTVIVRAGDFFGGERPESWLDLMILRDLKNDKFAWPGSWDAVHAFAYLPDLAKAFVKVAEKREELPAFERLHFRGYAITGNEMHEAAQRAVGRKLKRGGVPWTVLRLIGLFNPVLREVAKMRYLWRVPHSLANTKLEALIGAEPHRPLETAIREAVGDLSLDGKAVEAKSDKRGMLAA